MRIDITRNDLLDMFGDMTSDDIISYLENYGLELTKEKETPPVRGIYRRELGTDLIYSDGYGHWTNVSMIEDNDGRPITWACFGPQDWWVMVLNGDNEPMQLGHTIRILMNEDGTQAV